MQHWMYRVGVFLKWFYHFDELRKFEIEPNGQLVRAVINGPYKSVVITEQIIVESFCVHVGKTERPHLFTRQK